MTVGELLKILQTCPQDALVLIEATTFYDMTAVLHHAKLTHIDHTVRYYDEIKRLPEIEHLLLSSVHIDVHEEIKAIHDKQLLDEKWKLKK